MFKLAREAMRTRFELVIADDRPAADLRAAGEEAFDEIERIERQLSIFRNDSELFGINANAAAAPVKSDPRLIRLLRRASELSAQTDGAFDMAVGPLLQGWKMKSDAGGTVPAQTELDAARALTGMARQVVLDDDASTVRFAQSGVRLDPGAIGKGYAIDRAVDILRDAGIQHALLHGGTSTVYGLGQPPGQPAWKIALQHPQHKSARLADVLLKDSALSVSAVHGRTFHAAGRKFGHIIDPRSGQPVEHSVLAAWVGPSATDSDALSTALLVLGREGFAKIKAQWPGSALLLASLTATGQLTVESSGTCWQTYDVG